MMDATIQRRQRERVPLTAVRRRRHRTDQPSRAPATGRRAAQLEGLGELANRAPRATRLLQMKRRLDAGSGPLRQRPVQRVLRIEQPEASGVVLESINRLLHGTGVTAIVNDGAITLQGDPGDPGDPRYALLNNVIGSPRTVVIRRVQGAASTDIDRTGSAEAVADRLRAATDSAVGEDAVVRWDPGHTDLIPTTAGTQEMPSWLILGHELIHGSRIQGGRAAYDPETGEAHIGVYRNLQSRAPEIGKVEEMQTVGLPALSTRQIDQALSDQGALNAFRKSDKAARLLKGSEDLVNEPVTENDLRRALEMPLRKRYTALQDVLAAKQQPAVAPIRAFDRLNRRRGPTTGQLAFAGAALVAFVAWYYRDFLRSYFSSD